ncbi:hypothetical protein D3C73_673480 [compost metagenome]
MGEEEAKQGTHYGIRHAPGLIGQKHQAEQGLHEGPLQPLADHPQVVAPQDIPLAGDQGEEQRQEEGQCQGSEQQQAGDCCCAQRQLPAGQQCQQGAGCQQGAAEVVKHLPAPDERQGVLSAAAPADPGEQLPVPSGPAMLALGTDVITGGKLLDDLDIRGEPRPGEDPLEQIMAQVAVVRHAPRQGGGEGIHVIDALASEGALPEQILIEVGDGGGIGIHAPGPRVEPLIVGAVLTQWQRGGDPGLQYAVAMGDTLAPGVEVGVIEGMGHLANQPAGGIPWQAGIRVQGDDIAHPLGDGGGLAVRLHEAGIRRAAQQAVQLVELAPLALPPHPAPLARVEPAVAMEQPEAIPRGARAIFFVEPGNGLARRRQQGLIPRQPLLLRIHTVAEQGKADIAADPGEMMHLQLLDLCQQLGWRHQQGRHDHQGAQRGRDAVGEIHGGEEAGNQVRADEVVDQGQGHGMGRQECKQEEEPHPE